MQEFNTIINQYHPVLFKISRSYSDNEDDFQDLYQEMLIQLWNSLKSFKGESKLSTWIYRVALNTALTWCRSNKNKIKTLELEGVYHLAADPHEHDHQEEKIKLLYKCIRELEKGDRSIILLHLEGKQYDEISEIVGISKSNVGVKLLRIKKKLFELLNTGGYGRI